MTARARLQEVIDRTNTVTGKSVTADELLSLWRSMTPSQRRIFPTEAGRLLDELEREEVLREFAGQMFDRYFFGDFADAFVYSTGAYVNGRTERVNPFAGVDWASRKEARPASPERARTIAQAKKIKALADDVRGDANTRSIAADRLASIKARHGLTDMDLR